ncbi:MAG: hypothetical protein IT385_00460 [Deltaproteobacteria bacterium]|nr:hypothetical protein [Deltaproteobacteria bacterium]
MSLLPYTLPLVLGFTVPAVLVGSWLGAASDNLAVAEAAPVEVARAELRDEGYCSPSLKQIVRRVAGACGLLGGRGCQPTDASNVVKLAPEDFNALFLPLKHRVRIIQFDQSKTDLDDEARRAVEEAWGDRGGARFFFVVSRASPEGSVELNRELSAKRAQAVLDHLMMVYKDPDIEKQVGLLWLGEEFAQLTADFCTWSRSRTGACDDKDINRSAFIAWIDCSI